MNDIINEILKLLNREQYQKAARVCKSWYLIIKKLIHKDFLTWMPALCLPDKLKYKLYKINNKLILLPKCDYRCEISTGLSSFIFIDFYIQKHNIIIKLCRMYKACDFNYIANIPKISKCDHFNNSCIHSRDICNYDYDNFIPANIPLNKYNKKYALKITIKDNTYYYRNSNIRLIYETQLHKPITRMPLLEWINLYADETQKPLLISFAELL